jgi:hypothetical protein
MIAGMQLQQSMAAAQHRTAAMTGLPQRSAMPMGARPTQTQGQMMNSGSVRPQLNIQQQQPAAYTRTARNLPKNVIYSLKKR